jgi:hypothetical protein
MPPIVLNGDTGIDTPTINGTAEHVTSVTGFKNRILNGNMAIDQRNAGASVTQVNSANVFGVDRMFGIGGTGAGKFTMQQSSTAPAGFTKSLLITSTSAFSVPSGDLYLIGQAIEGFNIADLGFGTASASAVTLSFWVQSSLTGTFGGSIANAGWISSTRSYPFSYSIPVANTWTKISVTIAGDTTGTWATTNATGLTVSFGLGVGTSSSGTAGAWVGTNVQSVTGATSVVGTNGATFYITGVQLEKGSTATSFDYRPYGTELQLCQRYLPACISSSGFEAMATGFNTSTTVSQYVIPYQVQPRVSPTGVTVSSALHYGVVGATGGGINATAVAFAVASLTGVQINITVLAGLFAGNASYLYCQSTSGKLLFTGCEL